MAMKEVPIWEKSNLTIEEAAAYSSIGVNKIRELSNDENCPFVLWVAANGLSNVSCLISTLKSATQFN